MRLAIDFDNTLVAYDELFVEAARERELVGLEFTGAKRALRDAVRRRPNGELDWQALQADVYGLLIGRALPFTGAREFVVRALASGVRLTIVSHKTMFAQARPNGPNLRNAARAWLEMNGFVGNGLISPNDVCFESSRAAKIASIRAIAANVLIDDLVEIFTAPEFPVGTRRWLFSPGAARAAAGGIECFGSWQAMGDELASKHGMMGN
jgi:hypothetical protein